MVEITAGEAKYLKERKLPCIQTCRLKRNGRSRGKFYAPEENYVLECLAEYRRNIVVKETYPNREEQNSKIKIIVKKKTEKRRRRE